MMRRREFLGFGAAGLSYVSLAGGMPGLFARAAEESKRVDANDHALVVIELAGGNDGLNTVVPYEDALYYRNRPTLGIPKKDVITLNERVGLHPRMKALGDLFKEGHLSIVQGVGYPEPDRSHFRSMEIWHTASTSAKVPETGWLGRYLDATTPVVDRFPRGLALTAGLPQALQSAKAIVPVVSELVALLQSDAQTGLVRALSTAPASGDGPVDFLRRQAATLYQTADRFKEATAQGNDTAVYPEGGLGEQLRRAGQVLGANLGVRVLFVSQDGYDTHANQADPHGQLLEQLSASLAAFHKDLTARKLADKVVVLVFSEFGRRVDENASKGTDHGAASCTFLLGGKVKGGLAGKYPALDKLGDGDLVFNTDFRSIYATLLERWLGCPAEPTLGQAYPLLDLI